MIAAVMIVQLVCFAVVGVCLLATVLYLVKAGKFHKASAIYRDALDAYHQCEITRGDALRDQGDALARDARRFARWLP